MNDSILRDGEVEVLHRFEDPMCSTRSHVMCIKADSVVEQPAVRGLGPRLVQHRAVRCSRPHVALERRQLRDWEQ